MGLIKEFREFAVKGNVVDMAVGIIIGTAFGKIVSSLVSDVVMPPIGMIIGNVEFSNLTYILGTNAKGETVEMRYGAFFQTLFDFLIIALAVFALVKAINTLRRAMERKAEENPQAAEVPADIKLLTEIRDELRKGASSAPTT